jgi:DNA modification methylase
VTILQADYRVTLATAADAGGANLITTSPPYADARGYGMACSWTDADYAALGDAVFAALKPGGHAIVNIDAPVREWRPGYGTERGFHPWRMMLDWAERIGFRVPDRLAFARLGSPGAYAGRFRNDWEPLLWFQRPGGDGFFDKHSIAAETKYEYARKVATSRRNDGTLNVRVATGWAAENNKVQRGTLWDYGRVGHGATGAPDIEAEGHPARWPYRLAADIIQCFAPPGGLVCDPFVGAGTTAAAAQDLGRRFIGGDLGARADGTPWADVARRVLESRARQQSMF